VNTPLALIGSVFVLLGIPLAVGRVPPNGIYGFRTPATLADSSLWYRVNRIAGIELALGGMLLLLCDILWPDPPVALLAASVVGVVVGHGLLTTHRRTTGPA